MHINGEHGLPKDKAEAKDFLTKATDGSSLSWNLDEACQEEARDFLEKLDEKQKLVLFSVCLAFLLFFASGFLTFSALGREMIWFCLMFCLISLLASLALDISRIQSK